MKKLISVLLSVFLCGCSKGEPPEKNNDAVKWFDCFNGDKMVWDDTREYNVEEFPDVTFRWKYDSVSAVTENDTTELYYGMPVWSVYFCDFTGDGKPEICSTINIGSGITDSHIVIYDYVGGEIYELSDRGNYDYVLDMEGSSLIFKKYSYGGSEIIESGSIVLTDGTIQEEEK